VRHVVAHLVTPFLISAPGMGWEVCRHRDIGGAMDAVPRRLAQEQEAGALLNVLEANASSRFRSPGLPASAPLTYVVAHSANIRWAVGDAMSGWGDPARLTPPLGLVTGRRARAGSCRRGAFET